MFGRYFSGPWMRGPHRLFERGDLKYVILDLLKEKPRHGYEIIRALEERSWGFHSPSPGAVYPTLQMLEDMGYVTSSEQDGKRVYTITDAGRDFLAEQGEKVEGIWGRFPGHWAPPTGSELREIARDMNEMRRLWKLYGQALMSDPEKLKKVREAVAKCRKELQDILAEAEEK